MNGFGEDLDTLLESLDDAEFEERARRGRSRPPVRTPTRQSSFMPRPSPSVASQGQVQAATKNLDAKIETLSNAVKALETRTTALSAGQDRLAAGLSKELEGRKKGTTALQADLQSTKTLAAILPLITSSTVNATIDTDTGSKEVKVVTASDNQLTSLLPFLLLMAPPSTADGASKGPFGDTLGIVLLASVLGKK
jgi:hypothetical protein